MTHAVFVYYATCDIFHLVGSQTTYFAVYAMGTQRKLPPHKFVGYFLYKILASLIALLYHIW